MKRKVKFDLSKIPTNTLWRELERRESKKYTRRVSSAYRDIAKRKREQADGK